MNTKLLDYLTAVGLGAPAGTRRITLGDLAVAFGGRLSALSQATHGVEVGGSAPMLFAICFAARALAGALTEAEKSAFPGAWNRARAGLRAIEGMIDAGDWRAVKMRGVL